MGVIQRQGIKNGIVNYVGIGLGFLATLYIYPFDLESKGLTDYLMSLGVLFLPYAQLGVFAVYYKYFGYYEHRIGDFQRWVVQRVSLYFSLFCLAYFLFLGPLSDFLVYAQIDVSGNFETYAPYIPLVIFFNLVQGFFSMIANTNNRIVVPDLIRNIIQKIYFPLIIFLKFQFDLSLNVFLGLFFLYYILTLPLLIWYVLRENFLQLKGSQPLVFDPDQKKEIRSFNNFSLLNDISSQLSFKLDSVMVGSLIGLTSTGIYGIMFYMSNVLSTASGAILKITNPIVSKLMVKKDYEEVSVLYKKSSITMFIFGLGVFFGIWFLLDDVLMLTKYSQQLLVGKYVFLYLALAKIFDMVTSINSYILIYSQYYRYNLAFVGVLGVLNVFLNLTLIPRFGIEGAAMATCLAMVLFNLAKLIFIYFKLGLSPFSVETLKVLALGCVSFGVLYLLPKGAYLPNTYLNLGLKGLIVGLLLLVTFAWPIYWLEVSKDINGLVHSLFSKVRRKK